MAMGMMMLSPLVISLPLRLLLFVLVDGWTLTVNTLVTSVRAIWGHAMTPEIAVELVTECLKLVVLIVTVLITPSLVVGVAGEACSAATQINEQT